MVVTVHLPKVGMTMEEGTLVRWLVADGASVTRGQPLFEMETEKVEMEVEADGEGVLRQLVGEGTTLKPGAIVGALLAAGESDVPQELRDQVAAQYATAADGAAAAPAAASAGAETAQGSANEPPAGERILATPIARRLAGEHGVPLEQVTGTGPRGRITEDDVTAFLERRETAPTPPSPTAPPAPIPSALAVPYSGRRRTVGERMHESLQSMAQLTLVSEVRVDDAMRMLHGLNREWRRERVVATLTALVVKACALALREHPRLNSRLRDGAIVLEPEINVGFAVNLEEGLMVPVVRHADARRLQEVAQTIAEVTERAKQDGLRVDDVTGATFTVTSLEGLDIDAFTPVINPPQAAILGVGRVKEAAVVDGGRIEAGRITTLSLTFDHRIIDGEPAARFLTRVGELLARSYMLM